MMLPDMHIKGDIPVTSENEWSPTIFNYVCPKLCWKKEERKEGNTQMKRGRQKRKLKIYNYVNINVMCTDRVQFLVCNAGSKYKGYVCVFACDIQECAAMVNYYYY